jgi:hypothetical protein
MSRPFMQFGVGQLEETFAKSKTDPQVLNALEHELQYRQVPRAVALLKKVRAELHEVKRTSITGFTSTEGPPVNQQPELWEGASVSGWPPPPASAQKQKPAAEEDSAISAELVVTVDEACKVLRTTLGASWESIEQTRRQLVNLAHPDRIAELVPEQRAETQAGARKVNAAYAVLMAARFRHA